MLQMCCSHSYTLNENVIVVVGVVVAIDALQIFYGNDNDDDNVG